MQTVNKYYIPRKVTSEEVALMRAPSKNRQTIRRNMRDYAMTQMPKKEERESTASSREDKNIAVPIKRKVRRAMAKASAKREWQRRHSEGAVA